MKILSRCFFIHTLILFLVSGCITGQEIRVVITDSGLGGLAVMDTISKKLEVSGYYKKVDMVFVNALFDSDLGYNALESRQAKIDTFDRVLRAVERKFSPDIIIIGCNTLSVLYKETGFVQETDIVVEGIVDPGVGLIYDHLSADENSVVIITGTETTISEDSHRKALLEKGISDERIITQACPELQSYIERDPDGEDTEMLIDYYVSEAIEQLPDEVGPIYLSLNCSHYGYSEKLWRKAFAEEGVGLKKILNPNYVIGDVLFQDGCGQRHANTEIVYSVYSKVDLRNRESMVRVFRDRSPGIAEALSNYILDEDLF